MLASTQKPHAGIELTYTRTVFEAILAAVGADDPTAGQYVCSADGARVLEVETAGLLAWHPLSELMAPGSPNPLDEPWLSFPFSARQLAALMIDGWGSFIQQRFGDWESGPDEVALHLIGELGGKAREALVAAYAAYRHAVKMAPSFDRRLETTASELARQFAAAHEAAIVKEGVRERGQSENE